MKRKFGSESHTPKVGRLTGKGGVMLEKRKNWGGEDTVVSYVTLGWEGHITQTKMNHKKGNSFEGGQQPDAGDEIYQDWGMKQGTY